jgi:hypothetical protein
LFGITTKEGGLDIEGKWSAKASVILWGCIIKLSPILSWVKTFFLTLKVYFQNSLVYVGFEVLTAVVMKSTIFCHLVRCKSTDVSEEHISFIHELSKKPAWKQLWSSVLVATFFHTGFLFGLFFEYEDGSDIFLRNVGWLPTYSAALYPVR